LGSTIRYQLITENGNEVIVMDTRTLAEGDWAGLAWEPQNCWFISEKG